MENQIYNIFKNATTFFKNIELNELIKKQQNSENQVYLSRNSTLFYLCVIKIVSIIIDTYFLSETNTPIEYEDCPICYDSLKTSAKNLVTTSCRHSYHNECLQKWLLSKRNCPVCRQNI
jgi:hypothetical protein